MIVREQFILVKHLYIYSLYSMFKCSGSGNLANMHLHIVYAYMQTIDLLHVGTTCI